MFVSILLFIAIIVGSIALIATLLPLWKSSWWWVRVCEFPRLQIMLLAILSLVLCLILGTPTKYLVIFMLFLLGAIAFQLYRIYPYLSLANKKVMAVDNTDLGMFMPEGEMLNSDKSDLLKELLLDNDACLTIIEMNVLMYNTNYNKALAEIYKKQPDVIIAVETDSAWECAFEELEKSDYPHVLKEPLGNTYGMLLYSRLPLHNTQTTYLIEDDIPSMHVEVEMRNGVKVKIHAMHPKPPAPQESTDTTNRDGELLHLAKNIIDQNSPAIVSGDLNDVAWSYTTRLFLKLSNLLDPRMGRGFYNTFHAEKKWLRIPLDHFFHSSHFKLISLERLAYIGSDHFPMYIALLYVGQTAEQKDNGLDEPNAEDKEFANDRIQDALHA